MLQVQLKAGVRVNPDWGVKTPHQTYLSNKKEWFFHLSWWSCASLYWVSSSVPQCRHLDTRDYQDGSEGAVWGWWCWWEWGWENCHLALSVFLLFTLAIKCVLRVITTFRVVCVCVWRSRPSIYSCTTKTTNVNPNQVQAPILTLITLTPSPDFDRWLTMTSS